MTAPTGDAPAAAPGAFTTAEAAALLGVSDDTVRRWVASGRLGASRSSGGGRLAVDGADLAALALDLGRHDAARTGSASSARNRLPGIVTAVSRDGVMAQVELQAGPFRVVSLMSREAADELRLVVGSRAVATVKATTVVVESPTGGRRP